MSQTAETAALDIEATIVPPQAAQSALRWRDVVTSRAHQR
jgi:hypothetical protein